MSYDKDKCENCGSEDVGFYFEDDQMTHAVMDATYALVALVVIAILFYLAKRLAKWIVKNNIWASHF